MRRQLNGLFPRSPQPPVFRQRSPAVTSLRTTDELTDRSRERNSFSESIEPDLLRLGDLARRRLGRRACVAVLIDRMNLYAGGFEDELRNNFYVATQTLDLDVIFVYGRNFDPAAPDTASHNRIFERLTANSVDALVLASTSLSGTCGSAGLADYAQRFAARPLVSIGMAIPSIPSVVVDGRKAMSELVEHLITKHGCKHLAFIGGIPGSSEAESRLEAYLETLERHELPRLPEFVVHGYFARDRGELAMQELLARNIELDAVVCANDTMAFGAIDALRRTNLLNTRQIAVTGFDDVLAAKLCNLPLTTATQPFPQLAQAAIRLSLAQLLGEAVPDLVTLGAQVILRSSCGCNEPDRTTSRRSLHPHLPALSTVLGEQRELLVAVAVDALKDGCSDPYALAEQFFDALQGEVNQADGQLLAGVERAIQEAPGDSMRILALQRTVARLRRALRHVSTPELENLWHDVRDTLSVAASAAHVQHTLELHAVTLELQSSSDRLSDALDLDTLARTVATSIRVLGFPSTRVTRFLDDDLQRSNNLINVCDGRSAAPPPIGSVGAELFAPSYDAKTNAYAGLVFPLVFEGRCHGAIAFEYSPRIRGYQLLRDQVAAALRNVTKHQSLLERTREHERSVQERIATAQRMEALRLLAGSVAHDLNNALGPIAMVAEMMVSELETVPVDQVPNLQSVLDDAESIKQSVGQSAQIVMDLLTLGRQGRVAKEVIDINQVAKRVTDGEAFHLSRQNGPRIALLTDFCSSPLRVCGAEIQLARAVSNLLRNAFDASEQGGTITLTTRHQHLSTPVVTYETIPLGDYAVLSIADQGCGIPSTELTRIFEPYYSRKRTSERSGTGLGLAIVHAVVKEHEGFIEVESTVATGTVFRLYFPLAPTR